MSSYHERLVKEHQSEINIRLQEKREAEIGPTVNTKEYKKEQLIQALIKELGTGKDRPKRIRKVVNKYY